MYQLKKGQPAFEVVDGELAGRKFAHGTLYAEIPQREAGRFERVEDQPQEAKAAPGAEDNAGGKKK